MRKKNKNRKTRNINITLSDSIKGRVRLSYTQRRTFFTLSYNNNREELEFMEQSHELFRKGIFYPHEVSSFEQTESISGAYNFDFDVEKLDLLHFCSHNDYLDIDRTIRRDEWKGRNNLSIFIVQYKPDRYVWFDATHRVTGKWCSEIYLMQNRIYKIVICDNTLVTKIISNSDECSSLLFDWDKLIDMANANKIDCVIVDFDNRRPVKSKIYVDASNKNEYDSISELMRMMPEQRAQWMYNFPDNLKCDLKKVNFHNLLGYSEAWTSNLLIELSFNPEFIRMMENSCIEDVQSFLAKQYEEAYCGNIVMQHTICPVFDYKDYSEEESWADAIGKLTDILPNDIRAIRLSSLCVKINGTTYWRDSDYYKIEDMSFAGGQEPCFIPFPIMTRLGILPNKQDFPIINRQLKCDVLFPKLSLTPLERNMIYKFEKQYNHMTPFDVENDESLSLFLKMNDCFKVEAPYFINRRLPLPMIITGYNFSVYTHICKKYDIIEILD